MKGRRKKDIAAAAKAVFKVDSFFFFFWARVYMYMYLVFLLWPLCMMSAMPPPAEASDESEKAEDVDSQRLSTLSAEAGRDAESDARQQRCEGGSQGAEQGPPPQDSGPQAVRCSAGEPAKGFGVEAGAGEVERRHILLYGKSWIRKSFSYHCSIEEGAARATAWWEPGDAANRGAGGGGSAAPEAGARAPSAGCAAVAAVSDPVPVPARAAGGAARAECSQRECERWERNVPRRSRGPAPWPRVRKAAACSDGSRGHGKSDNAAWEGGGDDSTGRGPAAGAPLQAAANPCAPSRVVFSGQCYMCGTTGHSQNYCFLKRCDVCGVYGHSSKVCSLGGEAAAATRARWEAAPAAQQGAATRERGRPTMPRVHSAAAAPLPADHHRLPLPADGRGGNKASPSSTTAAWPGPQRHKGGRSSPASAAAAAAATAAASPPPPHRDPRRGIGARSADEDSTGDGGGPKAIAGPNVHGGSDSDSDSSSGGGGGDAIISHARLSWAPSSLPSVWLSARQKSVWPTVHGFRHARCTASPPVGSRSWAPCSCLTDACSPPSAPGLRLLPTARDGEGEEGSAVSQETLRPTCAALPTQRRGDAPATPPRTNPDLAPGYGSDSRPNALHAFAECGSLQPEWLLRAAPVTCPSGGAAPPALQFDALATSPVGLVSTQPVGHEGDTRPSSAGPGATVPEFSSTDRASDPPPSIAARRLSVSTDTSHHRPCCQQTPSVDNARSPRPGDYSEERDTLQHKQERRQV